MIRKSLLVVCWVSVVVVLLLFSLVLKDTESAIVAQVEPLKSAISYHKAIRVEEIYVIPGQTIKPGDLLVKVERPDLILDEEKKRNEIDRLEIERSLTVSRYNSKQQELTMEKESELRKIASEIEQLRVVMNNNAQLSSQFKNLTGYADTARQTSDSYHEVQLTALDIQRKEVIDTYELRMGSLNRMHNEELKSIEILSSQLNNELRVLIEEQLQQIKTASVHGTVGSVNAQPGELLQPYTTILSIYESNPSIIKAVMNEGYSYDINVGDNVKVESSNRQYSVEGKIIEIGARIVEYPNRLKNNQNMQMYGQEIFVKIPKDNKLLNGERVFVMINR